MTSSTRETAPEQLPSCRLYLISPPVIDIGIFADRLREALGAGDVATLQLRLKEADDDSVRRAAERCLPICHEHDVALLINDRPDLAVEVGADGVHVGQKDASLKEARTALGPDHIVGVTCHNSRHLALEAAENGADYVAFGAFFPTTTKQPDFQAEPEILEWWQSFIEAPCVAIGGITTDNCALLVRAGADFLAVSSGVWDYDQGPGDAVSKFNQVIAQAHDGQVTDK